MTWWRSVLVGGIWAVMTSGLLAAEPSEEGFWAFQPLEQPALPQVQQGDWPRNEIDSFILARLEQHGLRPAPAADRRALIRRVTLDLLGLPPTTDEVQAFVDDPAPDAEAYARLVDRLLSSPHYGERWGRHWLDVARYADSNGLDENVAHGHAWRYRDYVIRAFNADKPYREFVLEQLAGDLLPSSEDFELRRERLIATGFLSLGPKVLAEVDEAKMELDIVDEQIDTVGRVFLGLTLGCARCHDHKFDPLSQADYYALVGIFKSTRTMETFTKVARWHENSLATPEQEAALKAHDEQIAQKKASIAELEKQVQENAGADGSLQQQLEALRQELSQLEQSRPQLPTAMGVTEGTVGDAPLLHRGDPLRPGTVVPRRFPDALAGPEQAALPADTSGRLQLAEWLVSEDHPLTSRVLVNRIWRWHFGTGLVATPDNLGELGARPTHPELLDWLAAEFLRRHGSIKELHRLILLSNTYQMSSRYDAELAERDPENRFYWRYPVRRLEAEAIRDSMLLVSGRLDRTMEGSLLQIKNRDYFFDHTSKDTTRYDSLRRSVYLPIVRNHLYDFFQLYDYSDASTVRGDRDTTTVAPQALLMLNSDFVMECAEQFARNLLDLKLSTDAERIAAAYEQAYSRPPQVEELERALAMLQHAEETLAGESGASGNGGESPSCDVRTRAWALLCQAILASNEFIYVR